MFDAQSVESRLQCHRARDGGGVLGAVVLQDQLIVQVEQRPVVIGHPELVLPGFGHVQVGQGVRDEVVTEAELLLGVPVDGLHQLVDVGCGSRHQLADRFRGATQLERSQGDTRLLLRERIGRYRCRTRPGNAQRHQHRSRQRGNGTSDQPTAARRRSGHSLLLEFSQQPGASSREHPLPMSSCRHRPRLWLLNYRSPTST